MLSESESRNPLLQTLQLVTGPLQENCYLLWAEGGTEVLVFDPGDEADRIDGAVKSHNLRPRAFIQTHCHGDHIGALNDLKKIYPDVPLYVPVDEKDWMHDPLRNLSYFTGGAIKGPEPDILVHDGDRLELCGMRLIAIHVPGHSPGGTAYYVEDPRGGPAHLIAGDILFQGSIGRTDFPGCLPMNVFVKGIRDKLFVLPDETVVHPGHGPETTIGAEKKQNPFCGLKADSGF